MQCLICSEELFAAGVPEFPSTRSQTWYAYLLRFKAEPPAGMRAKDMKKCITGSPDEAVLPALALAAPAPAAPPPVAPVDPDIAGDELPWPDEEEEEEVAGDAAAPLPDPAPGDAEMAGDEPVAEIVWPEFIMGAKVTVVKGRHVGGYNYYDRLSVPCTNPAHVGCARSRSTALFAGEFGPRAAEFWLGAWLQGADRPMADHRRFEPRRAEITAYRDSL